MRTGVMKKAARLVALTAILFGLLTTGAFAAHEISGTALLFTYYDVRSTTDGGVGAADNYFVITNPDPCYWVQAHVRVRTGDRSVELLDFDVMLSPNDVFTFDLSDNGAGGVTFSSLDSYTISKSKMIAPFLKDIGGGVQGIVFSTDPADTANYFANLTSLIELCQGVSQSVAAGFTQKGYVEVIMEGKIEACGICANVGSGVKENCSGADGVCGNADDVAITANTLYDLTSNVVDVTTGKCNVDVVSASLGLEGREYFATIDSDNVVRLAHLNAETMDDFLPALPVAIDASARGIIMHKNTYDQERFSNRCLAVGSSDPNEALNVVENCFAYTAATSTLANLDSALNQGGADDMNFCFYLDSINNTGVYNKFGAAATFGPTMADLSNLGGARIGVLPQTATNLAQFSLNSSVEWAAGNGLSTAGIGPLNKNFIHSHYIYSPAPAAFDVKSAFAFIFPVMHFINEAPKVGSFSFYNLDEGTVSTPSSGFISPGLPGPSSPANQEASLQTLSSATPFNEGWVRIGAFTATNATSATACDPGAACPGTTITTLVRTGSTPYLPGYTGAYFIVGSQALSASLLQYLTY